MKPIRDPFARPVMVEANGDPMERALLACLSGEQRDQDGPVLIGTPTTVPASIIGAVVGPPCAKCGTRVWLSPSSQGLALRAAVCGPCVERALASQQGKA